MIVVHHLSKRFGKMLAVDSLNFAIRRGQVVGFLGPNGAGKTTTLRMITGMLQPTRGRVEIDGLDIGAHWRAVRQRVGYLPEAAPSYGEMRVIEYLRFRARLFAIDRGKRRRSIDLALRRCGLDEVRRRPIHQLSKGFRQRVGLAAALLHQPPVLILDEPTVGLDPAQIREVRALIRELAGAHTILLSTHILPEVELSCDHIIMIARGRIMAQGSLQQVQHAAAPCCRYVVETDAARAEQALLALQGVADVVRVSLDERWRRYTVTAESGAQDLRELIAKAVNGSHGTIRELHREAPTLEHLFVQMIAQAEAEHSAAEAPVPADAAEGAGAAA